MTLDSRSHWDSNRFWADKILGSLKEEIEKAIRKSPSHNHAKIVESFAKLGWETEVDLIGQYRCDALKEGVAVEVEAIDKSSLLIHSTEIFSDF